MLTLNDKAVGDIVKIRENGIAVNYIIVHKGLPGLMYDNSCNGVWLLRQEIHSNVMWLTDEQSSQTDYNNSNINTWLNSNFLNSIDYKIAAAIKTVKIPFYSGGIKSNSNGLSCKVFVLSGYEVGFTTVTNSYFPKDGEKLSYFSDNASRIAKDSSGTATNWWLRTPHTKYNASAYMVRQAGSQDDCGKTSEVQVRPAFILPDNIMVTSDGFVSTNTLPTITSDKTGDLGTLTSGFTCNYSVNDADAADTVKVTLTLDSTTLETFTAEKGTQYAYSLTGNDWLKITNGTHTFKIFVTDGKDTVTSTTTFARACNRLTTTLSTPLVADDRIVACSLKVDGSIPADAVCLYEVTNNANDSSPVWEDCTAKVKSETAYVFKNKEAANGFAFNFRISAERGASGMGGYISAVYGGFE